MVRVASAIAFALCGLVLSLPGSAQDIPRTFVCGGLSGRNLDARSDADDGSAPQVMLHFKGEKSASGVDWFHHGRAHHESIGLGVPMKAGFAILIVADDRVETYVFNLENSELLSSIIRSGSHGPANPIMTLRGICKPAGIMVQ